MKTISEEKLASLLEAKFGQVSRLGGGNGTELLVDCPFCSRRKLSVNARKGVWQCWHCHETGTLRRLLGIPVKVETRQKLPARPVERGYEAPGDLVPVDTLPEDHEAWLYLKRRKFDPKTLSRDFGLCYCSRGRPYAGGVFNTSGTIVIPVREGGRDVAWQARLLYDPDKVPESEKGAYGFMKDQSGKYKVPPKYFTMPGFRKAEHLFNYDQAAEFGFVVVTEGAFDAMRVGKCAVAAFGKSLSDAQIEVLKETWPVVVLLLDPDAGEEQEILARKLSGTGRFGSATTKVVPVRLSGYKDAGDAPKAEVARQILLAASAEGVDLGGLSKSNPFK